jgi:hypothetical protein
MSEPMERFTPSSLLHHRELTDARLKQLQLPTCQRKHLRLNHAHLKHLRDEYDRLLVESLKRHVRGPKLVFITATFVATEEVKPARVGRR